MAAWPIVLWNEWAIQILVLLSFTLQVVLLVFADIRRHKASPVLRLLLWLAYQLADSTAIYALGHLSLSTATHDHQLVAFWAPFLLLHLGGPDNITAYALEDNQLWQRHLLTVAVQVLGATYVLYEHYIAGSGGLVLSLATMLMFAVGAVKYAERTWALKCGNLNSIRSSLNKLGTKVDDHNINPKGVRGEFDEQVLLEVAHSQFHFCKLKLVDSSVKMDRPRLRDYDFGWNDTWKLMEMELSLLYDILYTKAAVTHTWIGYFIRFAVPLAIAATLLLFHLHLMMTTSGAGLDRNGHRQYNIVDVAITYTLLAGALFMEVTALLCAIGSTWALSFLCNLPMRWSWIRHALVCTGRWHRLRRLLLSLCSWLDIRRRRWSGTIGQYNLLHLCTRDGDNKLAGMLRLEERWNRFHYAGSLVMPEELKSLLFHRYKKQMSDPDNVSALGLLRHKWGDLALRKFELYEDVRRYAVGVELQEDILIWHIATDVFLANRVNVRDGDHHIVSAIEALSNYMMFLLVKHPYLLPGLVLDRMYDIACDNLDEIWRGRDLKSPVPVGPGKALKFWLHDEPGSSSRVLQRDQLAKILYQIHQRNDKDSFSRSDYRVKYGVDIAAKLLVKEKEGWTNLLDAILDVWMDFLFYIANKCSRESYAKKLNSGPELTAILWLMGAHFQP